MVERWTLAPNELLLLMNKSGPGRLGFAALLKFFQAEARFPFHKCEVSEQVIGYLVQQTKTLPSMWADYDWQGRTIKYHRAEIRSLFDFREATTEDSESVMAWVRDHVLAQERDPVRVTEAALLRFRDLKLEPPTAERLDRLIRSTLRAFEEDFCRRVYEQLPSSRRQHSTGSLNFRRLSRRVFRCTICVPIQDLRASAPSTKSWISSLSYEAWSFRPVSSSVFRFASSRRTAAGWSLKKRTNCAAIRRRSGGPCSRCFAI